MIVRVLISALSVLVLLSAFIGGMSLERVRSAPYMNELVLNQTTCNAKLFHTNRALQGCELTAAQRDQDAVDCDWHLKTCIVMVKSLMEQD